MLDIRGGCFWWICCLDLEIHHNILSLLHTLKDLRGLYAVHSFPKDISEDFCDDFIDS